MITAAGKNEWVFSQRREGEIRIRRASEIEAEFNFAACDTRKAGIGTFINDAEANARIEGVKGLHDARQKIKGGSWNAGNIHLALLLMAKITQRQK